MTTATGELNTILQQARAAQQAWAARPLRERLAPIQRLRARLAAEPKTLAEVVAAEIGKPRQEAIGAEILPVAECCAFLCARAPRVLASRREGMKGTMPLTGSALIRRVPFGVVAAIVPWNYPLFLCAAPVLTALAAGNAAVMKPSPRVVKTVRAFGEWLCEAGVPRALAPVLDCSNETGAALAASPLIDKIVFTGSSRTGRAVLDAAAKNLTPATLELSGFDAAYVLGDADPALAAAAIVFGLRLNAGRSCVCPRRVFVDRAIADAFLPLLKKRLATHPLTAPMDPQTLSEADALAARLLKIPGCESLNDRRAGDAQTAVAVLGGAEACAAAEGNFVPAIVVSIVQNADEALHLDQATRYALGASIFSRSTARAIALAARVRSGTVSINECVAHAGEAALPFGGTGESGYGVRGGDEGLLDMTRPQTLAIARGNFRPHHDAESEAEEFLLALLRARHSPGIAQKIAGWISYAIEGIKWRPPRR